MSNIEDLIIEPVLTPQQQDVEDLLAGLRAYNISQLWQNEKRPVACMIRHIDGSIAGGIFGYISWGWCSIEMLWVDEQYRGNDLATKIMRRMENYAIGEGITRFKLETGSFQALDFYKKLGYEVYAELEDYPIGQTNYYLRKLLE